MSITDQPNTSHPTRTGVIAGLCVALATGAALVVVTWGGHDTDVPAPEQPSYAQQIGALSDGQLAAAYGNVWPTVPVYEQIAALSEEQLAAAYGNVWPTVPVYEQIAALSEEQLAAAYGNAPVSVTSVNERIADALAAGDLDLSASFALGDAGLAAVFSGHQ